LGDAFRLRVSRFLHRLVGTNAVGAAGDRRSCRRGASAWAYATARYPTVALAILFVVLLWMFLDIEGRFVPRLRVWLGPPVVVEIRAMSLETHEPTPKLLEFAKRLGRHGPIPASVTIYAPIFILNRSRSRCVSLRMDTFQLDGEMPAVIHGESEESFGGVKLDGVQTNLGPEEDTQGQIRVEITKGFPLMATRHDKVILIVERISGRVARVTIPGRFPPTR
jgi:hypothetical protein